MKHKINLDALLVLDAIAKSASFSGAAKALHCAPSSVTYAIQKLEDRLGVVLFDRRGHRAHLTTAGKALLCEGRDLLSLADGISRNIKRVALRSQSELRIVVGQLISYETLLDVCESFYRILPNLQLQLTTEVQSGTWDALVSDRADLVIGVSGVPPTGNDYSIHPLGDIEYIFAVAPHHPLANNQEFLSNDVIAKYRIVTSANGPTGIMPSAREHTSTQNCLVMPNIEGQLEAQKRGLGVGYLPRHLISSEIAAGNLIEKHTEESAVMRTTLSYAWRTKHQLATLEDFKGHLCDNKKIIDWFANPYRVSTDPSKFSLSKAITQP